MTIEYHYFVSKYAIEEADKFNNEVDALVSRLAESGILFHSDSSTNIQTAIHFANPDETVRISGYANYLSSVCHVECVSVDEEITDLLHLVRENLSWIPFDDLLTIWQEDPTPFTLSRLAIGTTPRHKKETISAIVEGLESDDAMMRAMAAYAAAIVGFDELEEPVRALAERENSAHVIGFIESALRSFEHDE